jgi:hypothetical protein
MVRVSRIGSFAAVFAIAAALLIPGSSALAGGPVATKSGALINYLTAGKIRIGKKIIVPFQCTADCNVVSSITVKGPGVKVTDTESGALKAGVPSGHFIKPNGPLKKAMRARPGRFKLISHVQATDPLTGTIDTISHAFGVKR